MSILCICNSLHSSADHAVKCHLFQGIGKHPVVCLSRAGSTKELKEYKATKGKFFLVETEQDVEDVSSTLIRKKILLNESIESLTGPEVALYVKQNKILQT